MQIEPDPKAQPLLADCESEGEEGYEYQGEADDEGDEASGGNYDMGDTGEAAGQERPLLRSARILHIKSLIHL